MAIVNGQPVYCFKKALLTIHAIALRFGTMTPPPFPIPRTSNLPIFSDNVIPSMLVHLGVIDLSTATLGLAEIFPNANNRETLDALLSLPPPAEETKGPKTKTVPKEGPILTVEQAFALRAAAIDACELIVETARNLTDEELSQHEKGGESLRWLREITLPEVDAWIWAVAKDRADYRSLPRFVLTNTPYF
ncbi:hypothetical protein QCA50_011702 [Cerrena zonata]|uniref:Queuosine 5'-phosphate N-glycosylase/hydrolase n=1 Tax=Cerrena zonata TaxID=2478898 RepID=A0AAW0G5Q7_9APHY